MRPADTHIPFPAVTTFLLYLQNNTETSSTDYCVCGQNKRLNTGQYWGFFLKKKKGVLMAGFVRNVLYSVTLIWNNRLKVSYDVVLIFGSRMKD